MHWNLIAILYWVAWLLAFLFWEAAAMPFLTWLWLHFALRYHNPTYLHWLRGR